MRVLKTVAFAVLVAFSTLATAASAAETEWMLGNDALLHSGKLAKQGQLITKIECKDSGKISLNLNVALVRLSYKPNTEGLDWRVSGGTNLKQDTAYWGRVGYRLHQHDTFTRNTGLKIYCMLFYK